MQLDTAQTVGRRTGPQQAGSQTLITWSESERSNATRTRLRRLDSKRFDAVGSARTHAMIIRQGRSTLSPSANRPACSESS
eukprot:7456399-Alexandrium_andersonii.AAC.1